jgi:hypothetical protein
MMRFCSMPAGFPSDIVNAPHSDFVHTRALTCGWARRAAMTLARTVDLDSVYQTGSSARPRYLSSSKSRCAADPGLSAAPGLDPHAEGVSIQDQHERTHTQPLRYQSFIQAPAGLSPATPRVHPCPIHQINGPGQYHLTRDRPAHSVHFRRISSPREFPPAQSSLGGLASPISQQFPCVFIYNRADKWYQSALSSRGIRRRRNRHNCLVSDVWRTQSCWFSMYPGYWTM